ncbi:hypothetical protein NDU88_002343 [Pleurodeles waltl]|uniref:Uncharacterized protein n=1 Tax=Pleurodeles waltl TaxID=8319 RepID=A0AAV7UA87_PLEWA|nr:hypothetical protein NDU88_002343 [Pleurodeles waltl]
MKANRLVPDSCYVPTCQPEAIPLFAEIGLPRAKSSEEEVTKPFQAMSAAPGAPKPPGFNRLPLAIRVMCVMHR